MSNFSAWWEALSFSLKIYWGIAIPFTVFFVLQLIFSFIGSDTFEDTSDVDAAIDGGKGIPFQFFSLKSVVAFFTIFGWAGIASIDSGLSEITSLIIATAAGLIMMGMMASLFYVLSKATADGSIKISNAIGAVGEVYMPVPGKREGMGKVQVNVQGALQTLDAVTDDEEDIPTGKTIRVKEIVNNHILVVTANRI